MKKHSTASKNSKFMEEFTRDPSVFSEFGKVLECPSIFPRSLTHQNYKHSLMKFDEADLDAYNLALANKACDVVESSTELNEFKPIISNLSAPKLVAGRFQEGLSKLVF